jgi:hypothetical protein
MTQHLIVIAVIAAPVLLIYTGIHFGSRWIDRMLCVQPPLDPNKPIVRKWPEGER